MPLIGHPEHVVRAEAPATARCGPAGRETGQGAACSRRCSVFGRSRGGDGPVATAQRRLFQKPPAMITRTAGVEALGSSAPAATVGPTGAVLMVGLRP